MFDPSPVPVPAYRLKGTTLGSDALILRAATRMSSQLWGSQGTSMPALVKTVLLYQMARVSVPSESEQVAGLCIRTNVALVFVEDVWCGFGRAVRQSQLGLVVIVRCGDRI